MLITLVGALVTVLALGAASRFSIAGYAWLLTAVVSYALYCVFVEKASDYTEAEITYVMLAAAAAMFVALAAVEAWTSGTLRTLVALPFANPAFLKAVLYQGIGCSVGAFFLSNTAIARIGVNRTASFIGVATVVSMVAEALLLKEPFSSSQIIGAILIITGVYTANFKETFQKNA